MCTVIDIKIYSLDSFMNHIFSFLFLLNYGSCLFFASSTSSLSPLVLELTVRTVRTVDYSSQDYSLKATTVQHHTVK